MEITPITEGLPADLTARLVSGELVYYFSYLPAEYEVSSGCMSKKMLANHWAAITDRRVLYKTQATNTRSGEEGEVPITQDTTAYIKDKDPGYSQYHDWLIIKHPSITLTLLIMNRDKGNQIRQVLAEVQNRHA